ncbi:hypothetical protein DFH27DRAFT_477318, partial [Peziza echinospora]
VLGSSIFDVLSEIRANPTVYPSSTLAYDSNKPLSSPILLTLDMNGLRLRFDGADQRLRLIEVTSFHKSRLTYNGSELARAGQAPTFRFIYNKLFGPAYPGEYLPDQGCYILSYPGISFSFPVDTTQWKDDVDFVSMLSSSTAQPAASMAIFSGSSWAEARNTLFTKPPTNPRNPNVTSLSAKQSPASDEVELARVIHGEGRVELIRRHNPPFNIILGSTTPQDLIMELGPPTTVYHKNDHRLSIHRTQGPGGALGTDDIELETDTTQSENGESDDDDDADPNATDYFYNYYGHGLDVYISTASAGHVATKVILHGNVPGSYAFNRYRRLKWEDIGNGNNNNPPPSPPSTNNSASNSAMINSEMGFEDVYEKLKDRSAGTTQKPMLLNRGSDSPSSSVELLGGWDEAESGLRGTSAAEEAFGNTELYGFPGLIFEVLRNKAVSALTVF